MGIYLKGVSKPQWCSACVCNAMHYCQALGRDVTDYLMTNKFPDNCPLLEVPAHGRLIDADALNYTMIYREHWLSGTGYEALAVWAEDIKNAPTIIPAEEDQDG